MDTNKQIYYVGGMHCKACENIIEKDILGLNGVKNVRADLGNYTVKIEVADPTKQLTPTTLNNLFKDLGYTFSYEKPSYRLRARDKILLFSAFIFFLIVFFIIEKSAVFSKFSINQSSNVAAYAAMGLVAGFSSCAALVGGLLLSLTKTWNEEYKKYRFFPFAMFNTGRLLSFAVLGATLGFLGEKIQVSQMLGTLLTITISIIMIILGLQYLGFSWARKLHFSLFKINTQHKLYTHKWGPFALGALTFFIPCGFTLTAQANVLLMNNPLQAGLAMLAFSIGTLPSLLLISLGGVKLYSNQKFSKYFGYFVGMVILFIGIFTLKNQLNLTGLFNPKPPKQSTSRDYQLFQMEASEFEYLPREATLKVNVPVKWQIYNSGSYGCAQAVYAPGLYSRIVMLKPGLNEYEFTPTKKGVYKISCSMGMVSPILVTVTD